MHLNRILTGCPAMAVFAGVAAVAIPGVPLHAAVIDHEDVTYTIDPQSPPWSTVTGDPTGDGMADGIIADTMPLSGVTDAKVDWVEWAPSASTPSWDGTPILLHIDLGAVYNLNSVGITHAHYAGNSTVTDPLNLVLRFSDDGVTFGSEVVFDPWTELDEDAIHTDYADLTGHSGRYLQLSMLMADGNWLYATEMTFDGSVIPEPASLGLLALVGLTMIGRRRH